MPTFALGAGLGALLLYFFDRQNGRRRRHETRDRTLAFFRHGARRAERVGRGVAADAYGLAQRVQHRRAEPKEYDDATLAAKVETEIFRDPDVPKGQINVNAQKGVVQLRGVVPSAGMLETLVERTRQVQGVVDVESLLHLPGTEAPMHQ
jgi:osmotically-inducible protein OsmY